MRLLVTGAGGQLGAELVDIGRRSGNIVVGLDRGALDVTDADAVLAAVERALPLDAVVNCAAWTAVDAAEDDPQAAFAVNARGAENVARACAAASTLCCHLSTDYVFDGSATAPIDERATPRPLGVYGASKLAGEEAVRTATSRHQVVRTGWLFGRQGPNFPLTVLRLAGAGGPLRIVADQRGAPTWTGHLAPVLLELVAGGAEGTFHLTASGETSWHGFARAVLDAAGLGGVEVEPIPTAAYPTRARRPLYSVLENRAWRELGGRPLPGWDEGVDAYVRGIQAT